jgi:lipopolysaccharide transport system permease protein
MALTNKTISNQPELYIFDADAKSTNVILRLREIVSYRYLLYNLVVRDLKTRYKNSLLGVLWSMLNPLALMLVFTALFTVLSGDGTASPNNFPIFVLVGLMPWNFFSGALMTGTMSIVGSGSLIKKIYFPRELLILSSILSNLVHFAIAAALFLVILYAFGISLTIHALWVPVILLVQIVFMLGICFLLGSLNVFYRDILMILDVVILAWFFLTPIFYPFSQFGEYAQLFGIEFSPARLMRWLNPMASIIDGYRTVLWGVDGTGGVSMNPAYMLRTFITSFIVLVFGYAVFLRTEHLFGEKL